MRYCILVFFLVISCFLKGDELARLKHRHDLIFDDLARVWDEGIPMGNAIVGANLWQKDSSLRFALDRIDLWDLRPTESFKREEFSLKWLLSQLNNGTYEKVHQIIDNPYLSLPAPSKIPGAALEFPVMSFGKVIESRLFISNGVTFIKWENGVTLETFVHATEPIGWFRLKEVSPEFRPIVVPPVYSSESALSGQNLPLLGYKQGELKIDTDLIHYHQPGWSDDYYDVAVKFENKDSVLTGVWSISSSFDEKKRGYDPSKSSKAEMNVLNTFAKGINDSFKTHATWWKTFWKRSSISIPDKKMEALYYNEIYKLGCSTREDSYIIPLQGVWTADNGSLPPWKGDVHHDLNTQLSYWPVYTGNFCDYGLSYLNTLWEQRETNRRYTQDFYGVSGINVPGVATLTGEPMGGWAQYSMSFTVSAWLAHHFYLHWRYTLDQDFLASRGYPYVKEVVEFLEQISYINESGKRVLPISSSPEIFNNQPEAWFKTMTNYDLGLMKNAFMIASRMAKSLNLLNESEHWVSLERELPDYAIDGNGALMIAEGKPYDESHRHFSHAISIMPLSVLDITNSSKEANLINETIKLLDKNGPSFWVGYSYAWLGNMKARALDGNGAAEALKVFADCFVLPNGFHVNGDQTNSGKHVFTYRPFTLEGNFAFASGIQEMLLQSHTDIVRIFPAIPDDWQDLSFEDLRTQGAVLISASKKQGEVKQLVFNPQKDVLLKFANPFNRDFKVKGKCREIKFLGDNIWEIALKAGKLIYLY